jgi:hypothetical protein
MTAEGAMYHVSGIYRSGQFLAERPKMTYMVQVVMRNQNCRKAVHVQTILKKGLFQAAQTHTGIYQNPSFRSAEIIAVPATSA